MFSGLAPEYIESLINIRIQEILLSGVTSDWQHIVHLIESSQLVGHKHFNVECPKPVIVAFE